MNYLGIDLSKKEFDVTLKTERGEEHHAKFKNRKKGYVKLEKWLRKYGVVELHVCMEATNVYWEEIAEYLYEKGYKVSVVNPLRIKGFAMSQMQRNKTDKLDSQVIVNFCIKMAPEGWTPPNATQKRLRALVRHREALIKMRTQEKNRLTDCRDEFVKESLKGLIKTLSEEIDEIEAKIAELIKEDEKLKEDKRLLTSIKGIGDVTAHTIMGEMYNLANYESAHAAAADAGLSPAYHESGETVRRKPRLSKMGKSLVRGGLYMPALNAMRTNPLVKAFADRLQRRKKHPMVIIAASMRKLLHLAYGVLKNRADFDPDWLSNPTSKPATP